jgi:predicted NAD/FAD-dependent oxidoreductase
MKDVVVVGAGLAGLLAAAKLQAHGARVVVLEAEAQVGGRLATREIGGGRADEGAQFFTVRTPEFRAVVEEWLEAGLVFEWSRGWAAGSLGAAADGHPLDGHPRYAVTGGFGALARHLAAGLDVRPGAPVAAVWPAGVGWAVVDAAGQRSTAAALILTPPVPQSLALLDAGGVALAAVDQRLLEKIDYAPCLCALFVVEGAVELPEPGALQQPVEGIQWIADNWRKGISPAARVITVHAGAELSRELWEEAAAAVLARLRAALAPFLGRGATIRESQLRRWRYATPATPYPQRCLVARALPPLVFAGDAFGGPRIEGAAHSGWAAAVQILT